MIMHATPDGVINTAEDLCHLPDGTLITWLRIPGDLTSRAIAFVHVERGEVYDSAASPDDCVVWVSPGGWDPMGPADAGINYPAHVVVLGDLQYFLDCLYGTATPSFVVPEPIKIDELLSGGVWAREKALEAASRVFSGTGHEHSSMAITHLADTFTAWLTGPEDA